MSATMNLRDDRKVARHQLLATVSAAAILSIAMAGDAHAANGSEPMIWLDFSGQLDQLGDEQSVWVPDFYSGPYAGPLSGNFNSIQKKPQLGYDADFGLVFQPDDSAWKISVSMRVGRARRQKGATEAAHILPTFWSRYPSNYGAVSHTSESHMFTDFAVGKDVGIGILGADSTISAGVRIANMRSRKDVHISSNFHATFDGNATNRADSRISHDFRGVGPSASWDATIAFAGTRDDGQLGMDWGINAAMLFGRQTVKQATYGYYRHVVEVRNSLKSFEHAARPTRMRQRIALVPDIGAYAAIAYRFPNAKLSLGYRADWFFNAQDGGLATTRLVNRGFFGPFASISIGVSPSDF